MRTRSSSPFYLLLLCLSLGCERFFDRQIEQQVQRAEGQLADANELTVVLCGTGTPIPDPARAAACTAVLGGGSFVLIDVGPGSWEAVDLANLPTARLDAVLVTHFHSDHIGDLGEAFTQSWIAGRSKPLEVYGPQGTGRIVAGLNETYAADIEHRIGHHGEAYLPRAAAGALAREVSLGDAADASALVFDRNGFRVTMFRVNHDPVRPAVGYRIDYRGRSVVVSGDTKKSASMTRHAAGADLLVHEAVQRDMIGRVVSVTKRLGLARPSKLAGDILDYHASPVEAAEVARDAKVKHLVLTHLVPGPRNFLMRRMFLAGVSDVFPGEVTLGEDGMRFQLKP